MTDRLVMSYDSLRCELGVSNRTRTRDILDHNCRRQGLMESNALVRRLVASVRFWLGFHGCGTSLLYRVPLPKPRQVLCVV